jgi:hypothetical protein
MSQGSFLDTTVLESRTYLYRLTNCVNGVPKTLPANTTTTSIPCLSPMALAATPLGSGFHLSWKNRSQMATQLQIKRGDGVSQPVVIATLPPDTATYDDPNLPLGYYTYQVGASNGLPWFDGDCPVVSCVSVNSPESLMLNSTGQNFPYNTNDAAMSDQGTWALALMAPLEIHSIHDSWTSFAPGNDIGLAVKAGRSELIRLDAQNYPHTMYLVQSPAASNEQTLVHAWFDGSQWLNENVSTGALVEFGTGGWARFWFCLDSQGSPRVLLDHVNAQYTYGMSTKTLTYVSKIAGVWTSESLAALSPALDNLGCYTLALDVEDNPHVFLGASPNIYECSRDSDGTWTSSLVPIATGTTSVGTPDFLESAWTDKNNGSLFFFQNSWQGSKYATTFTALKKVAGQWQTPVSLDSGFFRHEPLIAQARNRTRLVAAFNTDSGLKIFEDTAHGWIETLAPEPPGSLSMTALGMDGGSKLHLLLLNAKGFEDLHE